MWNLVNIKFRGLDNFPPDNQFASEKFDQISARLITGFTSPLECRYSDAQNIIDRTLD